MNFPKWFKLWVRMAIALIVLPFFQVRILGGQAKQTSGKGKPSVAQPQQPPAPTTPTVQPAAAQPKAKAAEAKPLPSLFLNGNLSEFAEAGKFCTRNPKHQYKLQLPDGQIPNITVEKICRTGVMVSFASAPAPFDAADFVDTTTLTDTEVSPLPLVVYPLGAEEKSNAASAASAPSTTASGSAAYTFLGDFNIDDLKGPDDCAGLGDLHLYRAWLQVGDDLKDGISQAVCQGKLIISPRGTLSGRPTSAIIRTRSGKLLTVLAKVPQQTPEIDTPYTFEGDFRKELSDPTLCASPSEANKFVGWLQFGDNLQKATVQAVCPADVMILVTNPLGSKPQLAIVQTSKGTILTLPYQAPVVNIVHRVPFFPEKYRPFKDVCGGSTCNGADPSNIKADVLPPEGVKGDARLVSINDDTAVVEFTAPIDYRPTALLLTSDRKSVMVRSLPGGQSATGEPNVSFIVVDPNTVVHNYGSRIATRYIAVDLTVKNPSPKKIQLKKSAVWFEADYATSREQGPRIESIWNEIGLRNWNGNRATLINCPDGTTPNSANCPKIYRYGIDHNYQLTPEDYFSVLGTFDDIAGLKDKVFSYFDLFIAGAAGVSGTLARGRSYPAIMNILTGIVTPRAKDIFLNPETEKRLRNQLLQQSFADIIQIPSQSSVTTKVFLPRRIIDNQFGEWVVVRQLRGVHLDLEVVSEAISEAVAKGEVHLGMTEDQVIQALGVPTHTQTDDKSGKVTWSFDQGPYQSVEFTQDQDKQFKVTGFVPRLAAPEVTPTAGPGQVTLEWKKIDGATSYNVYRSTTKGGETKTPLKSGITDATYVDKDDADGLAGGTTYYYQVSAVNADGEGTLSQEVNAVPTLPAPTLTDPPTATTKDGKLQVTLSWNNINGATSFNIYRSEKAGAEALIAPTNPPVTGTTYTDSNFPAKPAPSYFYQVTAVNSNGESKRSNEVSVTPGK